MKELTKKQYQELLYVVSERNAEIANLLDKLDNDRFSKKVIKSIKSDTVNIQQFIYTQIIQFIEERMKKYEDKLQGLDKSNFNKKRIELERDLSLSLSQDKISLDFLFMKIEKSNLLSSDKIKEFLTLVKDEMDYLTVFSIGNALMEFLRINPMPNSPIYIEMERNSRKLFQSSNEYFKLGLKDIHVDLFNQEYNPVFDEVIIILIAETLPEPLTAKKIKDLLKTKDMKEISKNNLFYMNYKQTKGILRMFQLKKNISKKD